MCLLVNSCIIREHSSSVYVPVDDIKTHVVLEVGEDHDPYHVEHVLEQNS